MKMPVYRSLNFTYLSQTLVLEKETAGVQELKFYLFNPNPGAWWGWVAGAIKNKTISASNEVEVEAEPGKNAWVQELKF